jgi:hypothetical protein
MVMLFALSVQLDEETWRRILVGVLLFFGTTVLSFAIGRWWGRYQARKEWQKKQFLGRVIVSLNSLADGWLKIRTVFERSLEEVFLNPVAVGKVRAASLLTTADNPLLRLDKEDRWYILNYVLNAVAERFCDGVVGYDAGRPLTPVTYCLFLTCEVLGEDRIRKVRAMLIREEHLLNFPYPDSNPNLEKDWHGDRVTTLRKASEVYRSEPDNFLKLEVYV